MRIAAGKGCKDLGAAVQCDGSCLLCGADHGVACLLSRAPANANRADVAAPICHACQRADDGAWICYGPADPRCGQHAAWVRKATADS